MNYERTRFISVVESNGERRSDRRNGGKREHALFALPQRGYENDTGGIKPVSVFA